MAIVDKENDDIMLISVDGTVIRINASGVSQMGRSTSGVKVMTLKEDVKVATIAKAPKQEETEDDSYEE